jgi:Fur family transcriptional regulator, ferric uptake regulator
MEPQKPGCNHMTDAKAFTLEDKLARTGVRMTAPRRVLARVLGSATDHPDVEELHRRAQQVDSGISLATVYRTVRLFEQLGIVERHAFSAGRARYEQPGEEHHDHFVNVRTGEVIEFHAPEIEELQAEIARRHGYKIHDHRLVIYVEPLDDA